MSTYSDHHWQFVRSGGFDQVKLTRGIDIARLGALDPKLWVALACPVKGLEIDEATLALIDTDGDGRIRVPEIVEAAEWVTSMLVDPDTLIDGGDEVALAAIRTDTPEAAQVRESAEQILRNLGKPDAATISLEDASDTAKIFAGNPFNGDGIVPPASAGEDEATAALLTEIVETVGGVEDRIGVLGVDQEKLDLFFEEARAWSAWWASTEGDATILPLGEATAAASAAVNAVKAKVEDYFTRCSLVAFDARAGAALNRADADWVALAGDTLSEEHEQVAAFPLAHVEAGKPLPLTTGLNPAWTDEIHALRVAAVEPLLGQRGALNVADWRRLQELLAPFEAWSDTKAGAAVESLGLSRVREILAGDGYAAVTELLAKDLELKPEADAIDSVEKLVRFQRDFHDVLQNFVNFKQFYDPSEKAAFQTGHLYMDNRRCELVLRADDPKRHAALAGLSRCYLAYLDCVRPATDAKRAIVAGFTNGDTDFLMVGRNGVFFDRDGNDWDATVTKLVENPLSIRQAFWAPYKKAARLIEAQIEKFASSKEKAAEARMAQGVTKAADGKPAKSGAAGAFDIAKFAGIFAAVGLAIGAIGSALALVVTGFLGLTAWQMPLALLGALLLISGPSMLLAALKLRQRNLGPILEANGWAINARARINIPFGATLTELPELPADAERELTDPYAEKTSRWPWVLLVLAVIGVTAWVLWDRGVLQGWLGL